jgi:hypothetical protein
LLRVVSAFVLLLLVLSSIAYVTAQVRFEPEHNPQAGALAAPDPAEPSYCSTIGGSWDGVSICTFSGSYSFSSGTLEITKGTTLVISNSGSETYGITVYSGGTLTVDSGGSITIDNSGTDSGGVLLYGTFTNSGAVTTENSAVGSNGIWNYDGAFTSSGTIMIENSGMEAYGIYNYPGGTFTNSGTITIVNSGTDTDGIINDITFTNSGTITIENSAGTAYGIWNNGVSSTFTNYGTVTIENSGGTGIYNYDGAAIINECDATIAVVNTGGTGIYNEGTSTITNSGTITGYSGPFITGPGCITTTTSTSTSTSSTGHPPPPNGVQVEMTLDQFEDYGSPISASNYFTVTYTEGGVTETASETGGLLSIMVDPSTTVTISATSSGSSIFEEWCLSITAGTCEPSMISVGTSAVSETYDYFDLQAQTVSYGVSGGGTPVAPFFEYVTAPSAPTSSPVANPQTVSAVPLVPGDTEIWVLAGTLETFDSVINTNPATAYEQWQGVPECSYLGSSVSCSVSSSQIGPFSQGGISVEIEYYLQYSVSAQYQFTNSAGSGYMSPTLTYSSAYGVESTLKLGLLSPVSVWVYAGSSWSVNSPLGGSSSAEQWTCTSGCSGTVTSIESQIDPSYTHEYLVTFGVIDLWDCPNAATSTVYLCSQSGPNADGTISPSVATWEDAGVPFEVTQTPSTDVNQGFGLSCGYAAGTPCYWTTSDPTDITFASGCAHTTGNSCETEFTADAAGTVSAYFGIPTSSGSTPTCGGGGTYDDGQCVCPTGSTYVGGGCACDGSGCDGLGNYGMIFDPAYVLVTAPDGVTQVGCNSGGVLIDTMKGATISSCAGGTGSILVADPVTGVYRIQIFSVGASSAYTITLTSNAVSGAQLDKTDTSGTVYSGTAQVEYLTLGSDGSLELSPTISTSCPASVTLPGGSYSYGSTVSASITTSCTGSGTWVIQTEPTVTAVESGTFTCPCTSTTLFSIMAGTAPLTPGNYEVTITFDGKSYTSPTIDVSEFTVTNELPFGAVAAAGVAFAGLLVKIRLSRTISTTVPPK